MAAIVTSLQQTNTPVAIGEETFLVNTNNATTATVTPTKINAIYSAYFVPTNAAAATALTSTYFSTATFGAPAWVLTGAVSCTFLVTVRGAIAS